MRSTTSSRPIVVVSTWIASGDAGERRVGAGGVRVVALADLALDGLHVGLDARLRQLLASPDRALGRVGVHVELEVGVREHGGADVAAVHHHPAAPAELLLPRDHHAPHRGMHGHLRGRRADLAGPQRRRSRPRRPRATAPSGAEVDARVAGQRGERRPRRRGPSACAGPSGPARGTSRRCRGTRSRGARPAMRPAVDLPAPDGPSMAITRPRSRRAEGRAVTAAAGAGAGPDGRARDATAGARCRRRRARDRPRPCEGRAPDGGRGPGRGPGRAPARARAGR